MSGRKFTLASWKDVVVIRLAQRRHAGARTPRAIRCPPTRTTNASWDPRRDLLRRPDHLLGLSLEPQHTLGAPRGCGGLAGSTSSADLSGARRIVPLSGARPRSKL